MDFSKYDPLNTTSKADILPGGTCDPGDNNLSVAGMIKHTTDKPANKPWMASSKVILLIEYLRRCHDMGFMVYEKGGKVGLRFKPGLSAADMRNGRGLAASSLYGLLQDAAGDLVAMVKDGIDVPGLRRYADNTSNTSRVLSANIHRGFARSPRFQRL